MARKLLPIRDSGPGLALISPWGLSASPGLARPAPWLAGTQARAEHLLKLGEKGLRTTGEAPVCGLSQALEMPRLHFQLQPLAPVSNQSRRRETGCQDSIGREPPTAGYPRDLETLGDHIRKKRLDLGLTQKEAARMIGVDDVTLRHWESGQTSPQTYLLPRIVSSLGYLPYAPPDSFPSG